MSVAWNCMFYWVVFILKNQRSPLSLFYAWTNPKWQRIASNSNILDDFHVFESSLSTCKYFGLQERRISVRCVVNIISPISRARVYSRRASAVIRALMFTARLAKRAKVMFSQAFVCPSPGGEGGVATPNASGQHLPPPPSPGHGHGTWSQQPRSLPPPRTWTWDLVTTPPSLPPRHGHGTWSQHPPSLPPDMDMGPGHNTPLPPNGHGTWSQHHPPPHRTMRRWAVRILLECILVKNKF